MREELTLSELVLGALSGVAGGIVCLLVVSRLLYGPERLSELLRAFRPGSGWSGETHFGEILALGVGLAVAFRLSVEIKRRLFP